MLKPPINALAFDAGRVLFNFDNGLAAKELANYTVLDSGAIWRTVIDSGLGLKFSTGLISPSEFLIGLKAAIKLPPDFTEETFLEIWSGIFWPNEGIERLLAKINHRIRRIIISNTDRVHWDAILETMTVVRQFFPDPTSHVLSFGVRARKPEPRIFFEALKRLRISPGDAGQVLFIDDTDENLTAARDLGFSIARYNCSKDSVGYLEEILRGAGVLAL